MDASFSCFHVAEDLDGVNGASLVRINPVLSCGEKWDYSNILVAFFTKTLDITLIKLLQHVIRFHCMMTCYLASTYVLQNTF